jgi:tRNA-dihydrouridine synthase
MEYEVDGIMIGRAAIGYPWIFREVKHFFKTGEFLPGPTIEERIVACRTHLEKSIEWKGPKVGVFEMRRHYANYFKGLPDFKPYRMLLVKEENITILHQILDEVADKYHNVVLCAEMA